MTKKTTRLDPTPKTVKKLFALSDNQCSFKKCTQQITNRHGDLFGQMCHIEAAEPGGERYNPNQTPDERRDFSNLILLCPNHHTETNNEEIWTVSKLKNLKREHERKSLNRPFEISDNTIKKILSSDYLENVRVELDRENSGYAQKILKNVKSLISNLNNEDLSLEYEILECRCLQKLEKIDEVKEKYESLVTRFPKDSRALLYLAEISLINDGDLDKNLELLKKAEKINKDFWLLDLEQLLRKRRLKEKIKLENIDENTFPDDLLIRSNFYRLYATSFEHSEDQEGANTFIEKALHINPEKFSNHLARLSILESRLLLSQQDSEKVEKAKELLAEVTKVENKFTEYGDIGARNKIFLKSIKINTLASLENFPALGKSLKEVFKLAMHCHFDKQLEQVIIIVLQFLLLDNNELSTLLKYLKNSKVKISYKLLRMLAAQFAEKETLFTDGKKFFTEINCQDELNFISWLKNKNYSKILTFLNGDVAFAITIAHTTRNKKLKRKIIDYLLKNENLLEKDLLYLFNDTKILEILQQNGIDNLNLNYWGLKKILSIVQQKSAWDLEVVILQKLIKIEKIGDNKFSLQLQLFNAYFNLKQYPKVIKKGQQLLKINASKNILNTKNTELLLGNTLLSCLERGKIKSKAYTTAKKILKKYQHSNPSFRFVLGIETEIYIETNEPQKALQSIINAVKNKKTFSPDEYAKLYPLLLIRLGNQPNLNLESLKKIEAGMFVKLKNKKIWYFMGDGNELDATKISKNNSDYLLFKGKKIKDKLIFKNKYSSKRRDEIVEFIFPIEKYILWQVVQNFQALTKDNSLEGVQMIEMPQNNKTVNPKYLLKFMQDLDRDTGVFFEKYCENALPLAMLAVSEGGLIRAIGRIQGEQKGFINFSIGSIKDFKKQEKVAKLILQKKSSFYIDGTSALFLAEIGYLEKIQKYIPSLKVSQSVINFLGDVNNEIAPCKGQAGRMGYAQKKITYSPPIDKSNQKILQDNIVRSVELLESNLDNIFAVSPANRKDCFSEQRVSAELSDACILAQKDKVPILTEDFIYLKMNELETKKKAPKYFSSLVLIRILYEDRKISFEDYIKYFGYLSSYRFRFLPIDANDMEKVIFGTSKDEPFEPKNIKKLNLPLILSEDYGTTFEAAFKVMLQFFLRTILHKSLTMGDIEKILLEVVREFPTKLTNQDFKELFLQSCSIALKNNLKNDKANIPVEKIRAAYNTIESIIKNDQNSKA